MQLLYDIALGDYEIIVEALSSVTNQGFFTLPKFTKENDYEYEIGWRQYHVIISKRTEKR